MLQNTLHYLKCWYFPSLWPNIIINLSQNPEQSKITDLLNRLQIQIQTRFTDLESNSLYADASILDPRFKQKGFRSVDAFKKAAESLRRRVVEVRLPREEVEGPGDHQDTLPTAEPSNSIWGYFDAEMSKITRPGNPVAAGIRELNKYLNEEYLNRKEDPLQWWHSRRHLYPHVHIWTSSEEAMYTGNISFLRTCFLKCWASYVIFLHGNM